MANVKQRMLDIVDSVPKDYFDGLNHTEMIFKLMFEYIDRYGEDETTIIPGTNKHLTRKTIKEMLENKSLNWKEIMKMDFMKKTLNQINSQNNTLYDFIYNLFFLMSLEESEDDIKNNRVMTVDESKERLMQEYDYLDIK